MSWRITDWNVHFENHKTRLLKRMEWVMLPNKMDGSGYTELLDHPNGPAHFGAWCALVEIASKSTPRGNLARSASKAPENAGSAPENAGSAPGSAGYLSDIRRLSLMCRFPVEILAEAIERLLAIGWLELVSTPKIIDMAHSAGLTPENAGSAPENATLTPENAGSAPENAGSMRARVYGTERNGTEGKGRERKTTTLPVTSIEGKAQRHPSSSSSQISIPDKSLKTAERPPIQSQTLNPKALTLDRITRMRLELQGYMTPDHRLSQNELVTPPDDGIVLQCLAAVGTADLEGVHDWLRELRNGPDGQPPGHTSGPRSYSWFPAVLRAHFGAANC